MPMDPKHSIIKGLRCTYNVSSESCLSLKVNGWLNVVIPGKDM